jgi:hypothetical protein
MSLQVHPRAGEDSPPLWSVHRGDPLQGYVMCYSRRSRHGGECMKPAPRQAAEVAGAVPVTAASFSRWLSQSCCAFGGQGRQCASSCTGGDAQRRPCPGVVDFFPADPVQSWAPAIDRAVEDGSCVASPAEGLPSPISSDPPPGARRSEGALTPSDMSWPKMPMGAS